MKKIITLVALVTVGFINAQAFKGKGDVKGQVGMTLQDGGTGIGVSTDFGIGENISYGFVASYLLNTNQDLGIPKFEDRFDVKARFNANLGSVFKLKNNADIYPGLDIGLRNFGAHLGGRYFFTNGFGVYSEIGFPIAKYNTTPMGYDNLNNQFVYTVGASFNL